MHASLVRLFLVHPLARWAAALAVALPWLAWAPPAEGAHAGTPPTGELAPVAAALADAGIDFTVDDTDDELLLVGRPTELFEDDDGANYLVMAISIERQGAVRWLKVEAPAVFNLDAEEHASAAMRALLTAPSRMRSRAGFSYDDRTGTVSLLHEVPLEGESLPSDLLAAIIDDMVSAADAAQGVVRRTLRTGVVGWPTYEHGPEEGQGSFRIPGEPGRKDVVVKWAVHEDPVVHASTIISAGQFIRSYLEASEDGRERIIRECLGELGEPATKFGNRKFKNGMARLGTSYPPFAVRFFGSPGRTVAVTVTVPGLLRVPATVTGLLDEFGYVDLRPMPEWDMDAVRSLEDARDFAVSLELKCGDEVQRATSSIRVLPAGVSDLRLPAEIPVAAMVDETHPWIADLVREASDVGVATSISNGRIESLRAVIPDILAVWTALRNRDIRFSSIGHASEEESRSQRVRRVHETIRDRGANCADSTVLLASILRALGHNVHLAGTKDHALLGIYFEKNDPSPWLFIETTVLTQTAPIVECTYLDWIEGSIPERFRGEAWKSFEHACEAGADYVNQHMEIGDISFASIQSLRSLGVRSVTTRKASVGAIPPPPDAGVVEAWRRDVDQRFRALAEEAFDPWMSHLPAQPVQGYRSIDAIEADLRAINREPEAFARILESVDGETPECGALRVLGRVYRALSDAERVLVERLEDVSLRDPTIHGLPAGELRPSRSLTEAGAMRLTVIGVMGNPALHLPLVGTPTDGGTGPGATVRIDGERLCRYQGEFVGRELALLREVSRGMTWSEDELATVRACALAAAADPTVRTVAEFRNRVVRGTRCFTPKGDTQPIDS
ncbi:MAG: hypothetical protein ACKOQW_09100, partial [Phycisphaerales bacterium]